MILSQFFGLFPIVCVLKRDFRKVQFKWLSFRVLHSSIWLASAFLFIFLELLHLSRGEELNAKSISQLIDYSNYQSVQTQIKAFPFTDGLIFYLSGISGGIFLFLLAKEWSEVLEAFSRVENMLKSEIHGGWSMKRRIRVISVVLLSLALVEHLMSWMSFLYDRFTQMEECKWEIGSLFYYIATTHLTQIYAELPVTIYTFLWAEYMSLSFTFTWNFIDLFIIIVSIGVAVQFEKINKRLEFFHTLVSD